MIFKADTHKGECREAMRGGMGTVQLTALSESLPKNARLFSRIVLNPGVSIGYHIHEQETELFYFVSGSGRVRDDGTEWIHVAAGDTMSTPSGCGHCVENTGNEDLVILATIVLD